MEEVKVYSAYFEHGQAFGAQAEMPDGRRHAFRTDGDGVTNKKIAEVLRNLADWVEDYHPGL